MRELTFVTTDIEELLASCQKIVETELGYKLTRANPVMLLLKSLLSIIVQQRELINISAKRNLLQYADGEYLNKLGELVGVTRLPATAAQVSVEITLSAARNQATLIKSGTRISADENIFFAIDDNVIFNAGETTKTATATCLTIGEAGNGFAAGEICRIVDVQPFLLSIVNVDESNGGSDEEDDESLRERIREAPESFSNAGSEGAYIFHAKSVSPLISDVAVHSPEPGKVDVYILMNGGELPSEEMLAKVKDHLSDKTIRPLTDLVTVKAPVIEEYDINIQYWVSRDDVIYVEEICARAEQAVDDYINWQSEKLGRDISKAKLIQFVMNAGVKRVNVISPGFTATDKFTVAKIGKKTVRFEGIESE
ncbi:MAG: baseplate J/gp47 family protein [Selenomonadaceae bacterium]|nr:baseplate J/gp47 family protein [Selenomonadaceae bacterium]